VRLRESIEAAFMRGATRGECECASAGGLRAGLRAQHLDGLNLRETKLYRAHLGCILIDEAQDLPPEFFQLTELGRRLGRQPRRLTGVALGLADRLRSVSALIPNRAETAVIAAYSES
jgi:superfamily I DNA and RNA helicase